jgi:hypothetical protein
LKFQKDSVVCGLNGCIRKLNEQKNFGNLQIDKTKASIKDFYNQIRQKLDQVESKVQNELRGHIFIRSQNFSRMINQIQFQIDEINKPSFCQDDDQSVKSGSGILSQTQVFEFTKRNIDQIVLQADKFLASEKALQS